ncbi:Transcriptional regulator, AraC family protein [Klebsiella pneumoniae 30660/NJST258_1]|nr:Transcriptional regulator, AraC family protein [Klebsiella pneumoniae 30684/NJST258_2]AHM85801.1 Transcriptional regulator, AraC family protein [Klebsiella pneumoniae 30660/NJST258_1]
MAVLPSIFDSSLTLIIYAKYKRLLNKAFYKKGPWCPRAGQHSAAPFAHTAWNSFILCVISVNAQRQDANGERVGDVNFLCNSTGITPQERRRLSIMSQQQSADWVRLAQSPSRTERIEAFFGGHGYEPHRHDTYAIGQTIAGVQSFHYRGGLQHSLPGGTMVLHPDEIHDGEAGTEAGFHYRMVYIEPALIQKILGGRPLPFIPGGLSADPRLRCAALPLLKAVTDTFEPLEEEDALYDLAQTLAVVGGQRSRRQAFDYQAAERAREYIHACFMQDMTLDTLSQVSGRDRWSLSRDFRTLYGTSPWRYVMMRRLDFCRQRMRAGERLVDIAADAGFADQSHMTRQFISRFGLSPGRWLRAIRG